ncbi:hypothetical protein M6B38_371975 [Iris pallida]|uniref:Uncharacterized protein n=1 Tax=Iris pallida TaxID=29817 RepID=A0AAX6GCJ3_IRIPA|nr:hypothetical protein M6B38_371975 [Iris pallida]
MHLLGSGRGSTRLDEATRGSRGLRNLEGRRSLQGVYDLRDDGSIVDEMLRHRSSVPWRVSIV